MNFNNLRQYFPYHILNHRDILLYGFHFSFFIVYFISIIIDYLHGDFISTSIDTLSCIMTIFSYYLLHYKNKVNISKAIIMVLTIIPVFLLIYFNHSSHNDIIYIVLLSLVPFYLYNLKEAIYINVVIYTLMTLLFYHISIVDPNDMFINNNFAIMNLVLATILIMMFGLFYHIGIETSIKNLKISNKQKDILLKEVHHRVKNNLNVLGSILSLQANREDTHTKSILQQSKARIDSIALVHEMLYSQNNLEKIYFHNYVESLSNYLFEIFSKEDIVLELKTMNISLPLEIMLKFGLVINEMITNSLKYSFNDNGYIYISLNKTKDSYIFKYTDSANLNLKKDILSSKDTLGIKIIQLTVAQLDASLNIDISNKIKYTIKFKNEQ